LAVETFDLIVLYNSILFLSKAYFNAINLSVTLGDLL